MQTDCHPVTILPKLSRLFVDYADSREPLAPFFAASPQSQEWMHSAPMQEPALRGAVANLLREQNRGLGAGEKALANIERLRQGASAVVTGQQVTLFGGPLFTVYKAATAIARAQAAGAVPIFWLATEDHDLAEADHVTLASRHALHSLRVNPVMHPSGQPVGAIQLGPDVDRVLAEASEFLQPCDEVDLLRQAYQPGATFAGAFGQFLSGIFASYGLVVIDASERRFHALGAPVLRQAILRATELEKLLHDRDRLLAERGYHSQVLVAPQSSLLFLLDSETGARIPLKRKDEQMWSAGKRSFTTDDLLRILETEPERLSPNALLRPVFQDFLLPTAAYIGGPAEIAYFAQTQVLSEAILGRATAVLPRLSATLIEPAIAKVLAQHEISIADIFGSAPSELAQRLGARAMPVDGKKRVSAAGNALDRELAALTEWMGSMDEGLGRAANVAASKMRYQMNRLRRLAANYELQRESSLRRHVDALYLNLFPERHPQERILAGITYLARYGAALTDACVVHAAEQCPGHRTLFL